MKVQRRSSPGLAEHEPASISQTFFQETSLHGWKFLSKETGFALKLMWILVLFAAWMGSIYSMFYYTTQFLTAKTITSIDSTIAPTTDITFPSVYICNQNIVRHSFLLPLLENETEATRLDMMNAYMQEYVRNNNSLIVVNNNSSLEKIRNKMVRYHSWDKQYPPAWLGGHNCSDMILYAEWKSGLKRPFFPAYKRFTDGPTCCHITPYLDFELNETGNEPERATYFSGRKQNGAQVPLGVFTGMKNGLKLLLDVESFEMKGYSSSGITGFKVALEDPADVPFLSDHSSYVSPGFSTLAAITPAKSYTTKDALRRFSPEDRQCYTDDEYKLTRLTKELGYRYSINNCLYDIVVDSTIKNCSCFYPINYLDGYQFCEGDQLQCATNQYMQMGGADMQTVFSQSKAKCLQRCDFQTNSFVLSSTAYPSETGFPFTEEFCYVFQKIVRICNGNPYQRKVFELKYPNMSCDEFTSLNKTVALCDSKSTPNYTLIMQSNIYKFVHDYAKTNIALLTIFIKDPFYVKLKRDEQMTVLSFIGNAGGLLGLCMGLSLISVFEVFYYCSTFIFRHLTVHSKIANKEIK